MPPSEQPDSSRATYDQRDQPVQGSQTNIGGGVHSSGGPVYTGSTTIHPVPVELHSQNNMVFGIIATIVILAIVVVVAIRPNLPATPIPSTPASSAPTEPVIAVPPTATPPVPPNTAALVTALPSSTPSLRCADQLPADLPSNRIVVLEEGIRNKDIELTNDDQLVLYFTHQKEFIGLIHFLLFPADQQLKILNILDAQCAEVGLGDRRTIEDWLPYEFSLNGQIYVIRLGFYGKYIRVIRFEPAL